MADIPAGAPQTRDEEWALHLGGAGEVPEGAPYNRLEEWFLWLESAIASGSLPIGGGTMSGDINMDGNSITNLPATSENGNAVSFGQVTQMIEKLSGIYRGNYASKAALLAVNWQTTDPTAANYVTNNDWAVVLDDETQSNECWRYGYTVGTGWEAQFKINESPLSQAQMDALNSGITAAILAALQNKQEPIKSAAITLTAGGWQNNAQTVTVSGILADETKQLIQPVPSAASREAYLEANVMATAQAANSLTFTCDTVPTGNLTVYIIITEVTAQ